MKEKIVIREVHQYTDDEGIRDVTAFVPIDKDSKEETIYHGAAPVMTSQGRVKFPFDLSICSTLEECFERFEELAKKAIAEAQKEQEKENLIVTPNQARNQGQTIPFPR